MRRWNPCLWIVFVCVLLCRPASCYQCPAVVDTRADNNLCTSCPTHSYTAGDATATQADCTCNQGYSGANTACAWCVAGTYKNTSGPGACAACPPGTFSIYTASTNIDVCVACPSNSQSPAASSSCVCNAGYTGNPPNCAACATGKYKAATGPLACDNCPTYSTSRAGSTLPGACVCDQGYTGPLAAVCSPCATDTYKASDFLDLVRLEKPYIVSKAADWNGATGRFDSVCGVETCTGSTGVSDKSGLTVLALLPRNPGGPVFASESTRNIYLGSTTRPAYNATGGPTGNGDVKFDKFLFLSGGARNFSVRTNGGYTVVAVVQFTHNAVGSQWERLIDFSSTNVEVRRQGNSNNLEFRAAHHCVITLTDVIAQDQWNVIIAKLDTQNSSITFSVNGQTVSEKCGSVPREQYTGTEIGKQSNTNGQYFEGSMAGMFFVDTFLDDAATAAIVASIYAGEDLLRAGHPRVVDVGLVTGNGAAAPVAFVGGGTTAKMQWGVGSIPATFTICSITRYSGAIKQRILNCRGNPLGVSLNWLHGHWTQRAGATYYNGVGNIDYMITPDTDWVVACGRNVNSGDSTIVNAITTSVASRGSGNCSLGINYDAVSDWQLSRLYIWDYHLSNSNFALASSSLYAALTVGSTDSVCQACPANSRSAAASTVNTACTCNAGYTGIDGSTCSACPPGSSKTASGDSACIPYTCPADQFSSEVAANVAAVCWACPSSAVSVAASTAPAACQCRAGTYEETRVLNPPYAQRSYSSIFSNTHFGSLFDDLNARQAWVPQVTDVNQWMEIDAGMPMHIRGVITQGRGPLAPHQWVTQFEVQYRLTAAVESGVTISGNFIMASPTKEHIFTSPIYARYIRFIVLEWNSQIAMRAALIVKSCSSCVATSTSVQGSVLESACECPAGAYRFSSAADQRALALVPGRAQLSTLANRGLRAYAATAQFSSTAGPAGSKGAVTFDRATSQYLDGGSHTFNIATNGGFTAVAVVKFTSLDESEQEARIIEFEGTRAWIHIRRTTSPTQLAFAILDENTFNCVMWSHGHIVENTWLTLVATYSHDTNSIAFRIGESTRIHECQSSPLDIYVSETYVGVRINKVNSYFQGSIAGLYAVDALLTEAEIAAVVSRINAGEDTLQACAGCPVNTYKSGAGNALSACVACPASANSPAGSTSITACKCAPGFSGADGEACVQCAAGTYRAANFATNWARACGPNRNGACAATQSTNRYGAVPERGVDGIVSNIFGVGGCTHTNNGNTQWWSVDLGRILEITSLRIVGRGDCCETRTSGYSIHIGNDNSVNGRFTLNSVCVSNQPNLPRYSALSVICNQPISGRYVFFVITSGQVLTLCEVEVWSSACALCPANSVSVAGSVAVEDCECAPGWTGPDGGACSVCAAGTFKSASGSALCDSCLPFATSLSGSTLQTACACNPGYHVPSATDACTACAAGTYKTGTGNATASCLPCPANSGGSPAGSISVSACVCNAGYSGSGETQCSVCPTGTSKGAPGAGACVQCADQTYADLPGSTACTIVPDHSVNNANRDYFLCNAGFSLSVDLQCGGCEVDTFKTGYGNDACTPCLSVGAFKSTDGATTSTSSLACMCIRGYGTASTGGQCQQCDTGRWKSVVADAPCTVCVSGSSTLAPKAYAQTLCVADRGFTKDIDSFVPCDTDAFKPDVGDVPCTPCALHRATAAPGATLDTQCLCTLPAYAEFAGVCHCSPGFAYVAGLCEPCPSNDYCAGEQAPARSCPANSFAPGGVASAAECSCGAGHTGWAVLANVARTCGGAYASACDSDMSSQLLDHVSAYGNDGLHDNVQEFVHTDGGTARPYFYIIDFGTPRSVAYVIFYNRVTSAAQMAGASIRVGSSPTPTQNAQCAVLDTSLIQNLSCGAEGRYLSLVMPTASYDNVIFHELEAYATRCQQCAVGTFKTVSGPLACTPCAPSSLSPLGSTSALACACLADFYGPFNGPCAACPANSESPAGSALVTACKCKPGFGRVDDACVECGAGSYSTLLPSGFRECAACDPNAGSVAGSVTVTNCKCNAGFTGTDGGSCSTCTAGKYKPVMIPGAPSWFVTASGNVDTVRNACIDGGGELATINSLAENEIAVGICQGTQCYIGLVRDTAFETPWYWLSGDSVVYTNWKSSQIHATHETRTVMKRSNGQWEDWGSGVTYNRGVCRVMCLYCPPNSHSTNGSTAATACQCNPGYTGADGGPCSACVAGSFKPLAGAAACEACPGNSTSAAGSALASDCKCAPGFSGADGQTCTICAADTYRAANFATNWARACGPNRNGACVATQTGVHEGAVPGQVAERAVDGNSNSVPSNGHCVHTAIGFDPSWWSVDLGLTVHITTLKITGRSDNNQQRTTGFSIYIGNDNSVSGRFTQNSVCVSGQPQLPNTALIITCNQPISGRYVYFMIPREEYISLCEVEVYSSDCALCPANSVSVAGSVAVEDCECAPGYSETSVNMPPDTPEIIYDFTDKNTLASWKAYADAIPNSIFSYLHFSGNLDTIWTNSLVGFFQMVLPNTHNYMEITFGNQWSGGHTDKTDLFIDNVLVSEALDFDTKIFESSYTGTPTIKISEDASRTSANLIIKLFQYETCSLCLAGTYKDGHGSGICTSCPTNSVSAAGSIIDTACQCNAGFSGPAGGPCVACAAGTFKAASGSAACAAYGCPANQFSSEVAANIQAVCWACPTDALSLPASTAPAACQCRAGTYEETRVLNPPFEQRSYSSFATGTPVHTNSLLDDLFARFAWAAAENTIGQYMDIDVGNPMYIVGLITQGRGSSWSQQWVKEFRLEYRLDNTVGSNVVLPGTFLRTSTVKGEHIFTTPIYARYIRIIVLDWNSYISMRAALIVKSCSSCVATSTSVQGSVLESACECPAGAYRFSSAADQRALALVPGRAQLSTLANRGLRAYAATAQFSSSTFGPTNSKGAVTFDRAASQYLDGGSHQFNIATNGGFTAVAVVMFTGAAGAFERIFDFTGIDVWRGATTSNLLFGIFNGDGCIIQMNSVIIQNTWMTVVATYNSSNMMMALRVGSNILNRQCTLRTDRSTSVTYVGKSIVASDSYSNVNIAGLYAVDALLTEAEIEVVIRRINAGEDTLQGCVECPVNTFKAGAGNALSTCQTCPANSRTTGGGVTDASGCVCDAGYAGEDGAACVPCPAGSYSYDRTCVQCPAGSSSAALSATISDCVCTEGNFRPGDVSAGSTATQQDYVCLEAWFTALSANAVTCVSTDGSTVQLDLTSENALDVCSETTEQTCMSQASTNALNFVVYTYSGGMEDCLSTTNLDVMSTLFHENACRRLTGGENEVIRLRYLQPLCLPCPANSFKNESGDGAASCEACPAFASSPAGSTLRTDCACAGGYKGVPGGLCGKICPPGAAHGPLNQVCYPCGTSTYKPLAGDHACTPCPPFSHHGLTNQTSVDACACQIGYLWNAASQLCDNCPPGTFNNRANDTRCFPCMSLNNTAPVSCVANQSDGTSCPGLCVAPAGFQVTASGANLEACPVNSYQDGSGVQCTPCPAPSTFTAHGGLASVAECACTAGHSRVGGVCVACEVGSYKAPVDSGAIDQGILQRALALVPDEHLRIATLATRNTPMTTDNPPPFVPSGGPLGMGSLVFSDRQELNYLRMPGIAFDLDTNGAFTGVLVIKMTGVVDSDSEWERIFDFGVNRDVHNINLMRQHSSGYFEFKITDDDKSIDCQVVSSKEYPQNVWLRIVMRYRKSYNSVDIIINGDTTTATCAKAPIDRIANAIFGRQAHAADLFILGETAGMFVVDSYLDTDQTQSLIDAMYQGEDTLLLSHTCNVCPSDTTTQEPGSTSLAECVCDADFELVNAVCRRCVAPAAKHHPGNEACIGCGVGGALKPSEPHTRNACECQAGFAGARDACLACAHGSYATGPGVEECVSCALHATTAQPASASIASCFCSPPLLWEAAATGGPNVPGGICVSSCAPGFYGAGSVCALCLEETYKTDQGPQACTPCAPPRSSSRPGSVLPTNCSCPAGLMLDPSGGINATVASVGPLSALGLATTVLNNCLAGCVVAEDPATRLASLSLSGPDVRDVTVTVDTGGATLVLYACTSDCLATVALYGSRGRLTLSAPATVGGTVLRHTRRTATLAPNPGQLDQAAAERLVLQHGLRPGSTLWGASVALAQADPACLPCAQGLVCASYI